MQPFGSFDPAASLHLESLSGGGSVDNDKLGSDGSGRFRH